MLFEHFLDFTRTCFSAVLPPITHSFFNRSKVLFGYSGSTLEAGYYRVISKC